MNAARRVARAGRTLLIALLAGAVIIAAIVIAYVAGRGSTAPSAAGPAAPPAQSSAPATSGTSEAAPTGCLGGASRDNRMLLAAQTSAPHTAYGAVELAASFLRWAYRRPYPTTSDANQIGSEVIAPAASRSFKDVAASYRSAGDITGGTVPATSSFYLSTVNGSWIVRQGSTANRVTVDLNANYVINGVLSPTKTAAISATLVWASGSWRLLSEQAPDSTALTSGGTTFTAGC